MVHLVIPLALEVKIAELVQYRWMYPIERYLRKLKSYVRNLLCLEDSIAETYIANECLQSCSLYMEGGDSRSYWSRKSKDDTKHEVDKEGCLFPTIVKLYGFVEVINLDKKTWVQAHRYVFFNCESDVVDYYKKPLHKIFELDLTSNISNDIKALSQGPCYFARRFKAFHMNNGYRFRTKQYEEFTRTQNSGVLVVSMIESYESDRISDEQFVFAGQAQQAIFVQDPEDHERFVPRSIKPRDIFDMGEENSKRFDSLMQCDTADLIILENIRDFEDYNNGSIRGGVDGIEIVMD
ncbi:hypothetical protein RDI58_020127 [Solanum bulbocastanum]|uniref:DUF4218 domain-containing protein n=1 Tax=Solanum bulbocastanum TaxID=147425 RepID=A0AAN8TEL9_SOLBU